MSISVSHQAYVFLGMVLCGAVCGAAFDVFRGLRRFRKPGGGVIVMQDLLLWFVELIIVYAAAFRLNYAEIRAYEALALVIGSVIYFMTVSRYVVRFVCLAIAYTIKIIKIIIMPLVKLVLLVLKPVKFIGGCVSNIFAKVGRKIKSTVLKAASAATNRFKAIALSLKPKPKPKESPDESPDLENTDFEAL